MAKNFEARELFDGTSAFPKGINSGTAPLLLDRLQASFAINTTFRGSYATDRPPFNKVQLIWPDPLVQAAVQQGLFQGAGFYRPDFGESSLFAQISGRLFQFLFVGDSIEVIERTIPGDPNPATTTQVWMWQAENYLIVNDGVSLPIFFDGSTTRRSMGGSQQLQLVSPADFTVPAIGSSVLIGLNNPYTGPFNRPIYIDDALYQAVENANASYTVNLTNLTETAGAPIAAGEEVTSEPVKLGKLTSAASFNIISGSFAAGTYFTAVDISYAYTGALNKDIIIDGRLWRITATSLGGFRLTIVNRTSLGPPGYNYPVGTLVQLASTPAPNVSLGSVVTAAVAPPQGGTIQVQLTQAYTGADNASVWINDEQYSIVGIPSGPATNSITVINLTDDPGTGSNTRGPTGTEGVGQLSTVDELPPGRMGAYGMGRNVMSLVDGQSYIISDIVGGGAGTPANNYRDSVLKITENTYELGGGVFRIPGVAGDIRAIIFPAVLDAAFGMGPCQVLTPERCFSVNVPVDRTDWQTVTNPIQTQSLIANGGQGQNSTIVVDGDIFFRSVDGLRSLVFGRRQFTDAGGNSPFSHEAERILKDDDIELLAYGSATYFDNRVIFTAAPEPSSQGVIHPKLCVLNMEPLSTMQDKLPPIFDGLWTGLNTLQLVTGKSLGKDRCFSFSLNVVEEKIELYELMPTGDEHFDNGSIPITWSVEGPALFREDPSNRSFKQLADGECQVDEVIGAAFVQVSYKPDQWPCWVPWRSWLICTNAGTGLQPGFYPRMGFGEPSGTPCDAFTNRPFREFYTAQIKIEVTGHLRGLSLSLRAITRPEPKMAPLIPSDCVTNECKQITCENLPDAETYSLQSGLVFTAGVLVGTVDSCPVGFTCVPGVIPVVIVDDDDDDGPTIPVNPRTPIDGGTLILKGCKSDIVRVVPPNTSNAALQAIVNEMFQEFANQKALCTVEDDWPGVTPNPPPSTLTMTTLTPSTTCLGTAYSASVTANADSAFSIVGTLPTGLSLSQSGATATISGTPTVAGTTVFVIKAVSGSNETAQQVTFNVVGITTASPLPNGTVGAAYSQTISSTGMNGTLTWSATGLPPGLSINPATGQITGNSTTAGVFTPLVTVSN